MKMQGFFCAIILLLSSCVGTDFIDDDDLKVDREEVSLRYEGSFTGKGFYEVSGSVSLFRSASDSILVSFGEDFNSSNGPGLYVFLSNFSNQVNGGIELGALKANSGSQTYNVTRLDTTINLASYNHVIVHCKPFNVVFGYAELK